MPEEESIEVVHSEETEDAVEDTPSDTTEDTAEQPTEDAVAEVAAPVEPALFELPDGRKVDAETLQTEWKNNFYPEFTRRSQELAELKKGNLPEATQTPPSPYADPEYVPKSYAEIIEAAKQAALTELAQQEQARIQGQKAVEDAVVQQLTEVKAIDPNVNENQLFLHANKYGFRDLKVAHQNMKDMAEIVKKTQQVTADNIQKRNDPVSVTQGAAIGSRPDPSAFGTAVEYMRSLKN